MLAVGVTFSSYQLAEGYGLLFLVGLAIPVFVFFFQIFQDLNYRILHLIGYWAFSVSKFRYRGFSFPKFYEKSQQDSHTKASIMKSNYYYRLFSIVQWALGVFVGELFLIGYLFASAEFGFELHPSVVFILFLGTVSLFFFFWGKLQKKLYLEIAYVENEREFYYRKKKNE